MRLYDPATALLSLHIFKTGGTSFMECLKLWFGDGYYQHYADHANGRKPYLIPWNDKYWKRVHNPDNRPICIHGHFTIAAGVGIEDYYPGHSQIVTFLRDPVEAHLSAYHYQHKEFQNDNLYFKGEKLAEFPFRDLEYFFTKFRSFLLDDFPWELNTGNFKEILSEQFIHIGLTETMQQSTDIIAEKLGKSGVEVARRNVTLREGMDQLPEFLRDRFKEENPLEFAIYDWVRELNCPEC